MNSSIVYDAMNYMRQSVWLAAVVLLGLIAGYFLLEPVISHSQAYDQFTVTQQVTAEISFLTAANDITMSPSLPGITGGTASGSAQVVVYTNNTTGYTMTLAASGSPAMQGTTQGDSIPDYTPASTYVPDYSHTVAANAAEFGYTVSASTTGDLAAKFLDNGSNACGTGSNDTNGFSTCWYNASTTATSTVNRTTATPASGATTTIFFKTLIQSNPSDSVAEDIYVATTTLTATVNP